LSNFYDITERRHAEDGLRESEQKFRTIIEQSTEGFVLIDVTGQIIEWNQAQTRISGSSRVKKRWAVLSGRRSCA